MSVIAAIFARGGSKGVANKNLRTVGNQSLVERAIRQALAVPEVGRVILSTDSPRIAEVGVAAGAEVPWLRPDSLASDTAAEWDAWKHLESWLREGGGEPDRILVVPCTAPLRDPDDLARCIRASGEPGVDVVITVSRANRNPWFNMVTLGDDGEVRLVNEPVGRIHRRQDAPVVYDMATVGYVVRPAYLRSASSLFEGTVRAVVIPPERALDIDTELDLKLAQLSVEEAGGERL